MKRWVNLAWGLGAALIATAAWAQGEGNAVRGGYQPRNLWESLLSTVLFSLVGIVLAIVGFKLFDLAIRANMEQEICEKNNMAAALLAAAVVLGTCLIVAAVVTS